MVTEKYNIKTYYIVVRVIKLKMEKWFVYNITKKYNLNYKDLFMDIFVIRARKEFEHILL